MMSTKTTTIEKSYISEVTCLTGWIIRVMYCCFCSFYGWFAVASLKKNNDYSNCFDHLSIITLVLQVHFCLKKWWIHAVLKESVPSLMLQKDVLVSLKGKRMLVLQFGGEWVETILSILFVLILLSELLFLFWMAHAIRQGRLLFSLCLLCQTSCLKQRFVLRCSFWCLYFEGGFCAPTKLRWAWCNFFVNYSIPFF